MSGSDYVGLTLESAIVKAKQALISCRIVRIDAKYMIITGDMKVGRLNFEVENNIVVKVTNG